MSKILIVDDEKDIRDALTQLLARGGYTNVVHAVDGNDALPVYLYEAPDLIISDINMPNCDGHTFVTKLRSLPNSEFIPIIFLSAKTSSLHQQEGYNSGVDNYICKPIERKDRATFLAMIGSLLVRSARQRKTFYESARCKLTDLLRRDAFFEALDQQIALNQRDDLRSSLAILDIDHFKQVNDTYGHLVGDKILKEFASVIKDALRKTDQIFRYGGEEFVILFPNTSGKTLEKAASRVKEAVARTTFVNEIPITFSAGLYELPDTPVESEADNYIELADKTLYEAKRSGRNKILLYESSTSNVKEVKYE